MSGPVPGRVLVIPLRRLGDCLLTTPLLRRLHESVPSARVDVLVEAGARRVFEGNPACSEILEYDPRSAAAWIRRVRARRYDWVIDVLSNPRSALISALSGAPERAGFSVPFWGRTYTVPVVRGAVPEYAASAKMRLLEGLALRAGVPLRRGSLDSEFHTTPEDEACARDWLDSMPGGRQGPLIALVPTHRRSVRRWTARGFAGLARLLEEHLGARVFLAWGPGEEGQRDEVLSQAAGSLVPLPPLSLGRMAALFRSCGLVIANDNGPRHLAAAMGTSTLTVFGPTRPGDWNPPGDARHASLGVPGLNCLGCNLNRCPYGHECMNWLGPEAVFRAACRALGRSPAAVLNP